MTLLLNESGVVNGASPASIQIFTDGGSLCHFALGMLAGSELFTAKDSLMLFGGFTAYQLSQAQGGVAWARTGGELVEFVLGMLLMRLLPLLWGQ